VGSADSQERSSLWAYYSITKDSHAREDLILNYAPLVKYVAGRLAMTLPAYIDPNDLVSYGFFGLMEAIERFVPERGVRFETYAVARIRGAMLDGLRALDWVPTSVRQRTKEIERAYQQLEAKLGRAATDEEIAGHLGITMDKLQGRLKETAGTSLLSLDELLSDEPNSTGRRNGWALADDSVNPPDVQAEIEDVKRVLAEAIEVLPEKERLVVALFYYEGLTAKEIAEVMELSQSRISQLHSKAIMRLRGKLARDKMSLL
jgi:RNA polymerase sigma factor for flagellar operon FliA